MNGELTNGTSGPLLVYGPKQGNESFDNSLYCLPAGRKTPPNWDCDGFYLPNDCIAVQALSDVRGPAAIKYRNYRSPVIESPVDHRERYSCPLNEGLYRAGEIHWSIPNIARTAIPGDYPEVPGHQAL